MQHQKFMRIALRLAKKGSGRVSPNPMVGAVIVKNNEIIGKGYHKKIGDKHAEINAIENAGNNVFGSTLYVTLEPCNHYGKTSPCTKKIIESGISHVVIAMDDCNQDVVGNGKKFLRQCGLKVTSHICKEEAELLNENYIKYIKTGLPFVIVKCALTLDGRIATKFGDSKWITGIKSRQYAHNLRNEVDIVMVGVRTINKDDPSLTTRLINEKGVDSIRMVLDTNFTISNTAKIVTQKSIAQTCIVTRKNVDIKNKMNDFENLNVKILPVPEKKNKIDFFKLLSLIGNMGFSSVLIEGGSKLIGTAISSQLVDKVYFFYAPKILTGDDGLSMCSGIGPEMINDCVKLKDMFVKKIGKDVLISAYISKS